LNCNKREKKKVIRDVIRIRGRRTKKNPLTPQYEMEKKGKIKSL
jgi:hypothetical protein